MKRRFWIVAFVLLIFSIGCRTVREGQLPPSKISEDRNQRTVDYLFHEGHRYKAMNRLGDAYECFKQVVAQCPSHDVSHYQLGLIEEAMGKKALALESFRQAYNIDKSNDSYLMKTATMALQLDKSSVSLPLLQLYVKRKPDDLEALYLLSEIFVTSEQYDQALQQMNQMERIVGTNPSFGIERARVYAMMGDLAKTKLELNNLVNSYPSESRYPLIAYQFFGVMGDEELAISYIDKGLERMPENGDLLLQKAEFCEQQGDTVEQVSMIKRALLSDEIELDVKLDALQKFFVQVLRKNQSIDESERLLQTLLDKHPHAASIHELYSALLIEKREFVRAIEQTEMAIDLEPSNFVYWLQEIRLYLQLEQYTEALSRCKAAKAYHRDNFDLYFWEGVTYSLAHKYELAVESLLHSLDLLPKEVAAQRGEVYAQLGDIYQQLERREESFSYYEKALEINPRNWLVMNNYAYFLSLRNEDLDRAESMAAKVIASVPNNATYLDTYAWIFFKKQLYSMALFYIKSAMRYGGDESAVVVEHYGDILYHNEEKERALEQWRRALELGGDSKVLLDKIDKKIYIIE